MCSHNECEAETTLANRSIQANKHYSHVLKFGSEAENFDKDNTYLHGNFK